jgi:hypothetical protein
MGHQRHNDTGWMFFLALVRGMFYIIVGTYVPGTARTAAIPLGDVP